MLTTSDRPLRFQGHRECRSTWQTEGAHARWTVSGCMIRAVTQDRAAIAVLQALVHHNVRYITITTVYMLITYNRLLTPRIHKDCRNTWVLMLAAHCVMA